MITYITRTTGSKWKSRLTLGIFATSFSFLKQQGASNKPNQEIYSTTKKPKKKNNNLKSSFAREFLHISLCLDMGTRLGPWNRRASNIHNKPDFPHCTNQNQNENRQHGAKTPRKTQEDHKSKMCQLKTWYYPKNKHTHTSIHIRSERKSFESPGREDAFSKNNTPKRGRAGPSGCQMRNSKSDSWETILILLTTCKCGDERRRGLANQADAHTNGCPQQLWKKNLPCARAHTKRGRGM